ncbi:MAG: RNA polymerase subunit sigma-70, partial [Muribaculum sp.]|nr:RNA polymerase subunit sigma-70 [Muribaculum sp.]
DRVARVRDVSGQLPPNQAEVIVLRDIEGHTVEEIQAKTGLTSGNIRVLLCRARNYVRKYFVSI